MFYPVHSLGYSAIDGTCDAPRVRVAMVMVPEGQFLSPALRMRDMSHDMQEALLTAPGSPSKYTRYSAERKHGYRLSQDLPLMVPVRVVLFPPSRERSTGAVVSADPCLCLLAQRTLAQEQAPSRLFHCQKRKLV